MLKIDTFKSALPNDYRMPDKAFQCFFLLTEDLSQHLDSCKCGVMSLPWHHKEIVFLVALLETWYLLPWTLRTKQSFSRYGGGKWGSQSVKDLLKVTQLVTGRVKPTEFLYPSYYPSEYNRIHRWLCCLAIRYRWNPLFWTLLDAFCISSWAFFIFRY